MSLGYSAPLGLFGHTQDLDEQFDSAVPAVATPAVPGGPRSTPGVTPSFWTPARTPTLHYERIYLGKWGDRGVPSDPTAAIQQIIALANTSQAMLVAPTPARGMIKLQYGRDDKTELQAMESDWRKDRNLAAYRPGAQPHLLDWAANYGKWVLEGKWGSPTGLMPGGLTPEEIDAADRKPSAVTELLFRLKAGTRYGLPPVKDDPLFWNVARPALELAQIIENVRTLNGIMLRTIWPLPDDDPERWTRAAYIWTAESNFLFPAGWVTGHRTEYQLLPSVKNAAQELMDEINVAMNVLNAEVNNAAAAAGQPPPATPAGPKHDPGGTGSWWLAAAQVGLIGTIGYLMYKYGYFGKVAPRRGRGRMAIPKLSHPKRGEKIATFRVPT